MSEPEPLNQPEPMNEPEPLTFEELMEALEALTDRLATGDLGIEQAAEIYEQAEAIHARARHRLAEVSERIARLSPGTSPETGANRVSGKTE